MPAEVSFHVSFARTVSAEAGSCAAAGVKLVNFTVSAARPGQHFTIRPDTSALQTGLALGTPYCLSAGTLVVPFINPTAGDVTQAGINYRVVAL